MEENGKETNRTAETAEGGEKELGQEELRKATGGSLYLDGAPRDSCPHENKRKTGLEREDSRFIFWSQHQYQYYCPDCEKTFWVDEERP